MSVVPSPAVARRRPALWSWVVAASGGLLVAIAVAVGVWWGASSHTRVTTFDARGTIPQVVLDLAGADLALSGGDADAPIRVERTDRYAFDHAARARRRLQGGRLTVSSRCPRVLLGECRASYRVTVPPNVELTVRATSGDVVLDGFRGTAHVTTTTGRVVVGGYCGFGLTVRTVSGDVDAAAVCAPERMALRSTEGGVRAVVPPGSYRIDAASNTGAHSVRGLTSAEGSSFQIQALSGSGDVSVEAAPA
ncbi:MAG TPA: DUF4097 family beta strand repeat-containing protein [Solirubrobacteraceae bacterium]|nr:DUF4097 family beta strand repeat-containing protein [Solirubrobacteraceae bacterium]